MAENPRGWTYKDADNNLKAAQEALAFAKKNKAPRQQIKDLQREVNNAQAIRNQF